MRVWSHGTVYAYKEKGCRCDACREAESRKKRQWRAEAKAEGRASYVREITTSRKAKECRGGSCERCGQPTRYAGKGNSLAGASRFCRPCSGARTGLAKRGHGPTVEKALAFIGNGERSYTEIREYLGLTKGHTASMLNRLTGYGLVVRVARGRYRRSAA